MNQRSFGVDPAEYPFESRWFEHSGVSMHYIDEGQGIPVVMCHGNPTWSYIYRRIIKALSPDFRCVVYDLPGFGYSGHPAGYGYTPQEHAAWVEYFLLEHLKLDRFILVMQDWGGPIGLSIATKHPDRILGMVISSSWAWPSRAVGRIFSCLMGTRLGQWLILRHNFFAGTLVPMLLGKNASRATLKAYADPFPTPASRKGTAVFPIQILAAKPWLAEIEGRLDRLTTKPTEFVFGLKDLGTRPADMALWRRHFPNAGVQMIADANHFTQEACPDSYVIGVRRLAAKLAGPAPHTNSSLRPNR